MKNDLFTIDDFTLGEEEKLKLIDFFEIEVNYQKSYR